MSFDAEAAARALLDARREGRSAGPLPAGIAPRDEDEGVAAQVALARLMGALPPAGFKIGGTTKRMQAYLGMSGPAAGFMPQAGVQASGFSRPWPTTRPLGVECEIAVRLGRDLAGSCDFAEAAEAVGELFAAIEIVENRYGPPPAGDLKLVGTPTLIADQIYHVGAVLGTPAADWGVLDLEAIPGRLLVNDEVRGTGVGADLLGHPLNALTWLAGSSVAAGFGGLKAGQVVMLGSVTPPIWLEGPCIVRVQFDGLAPVTLTFI